MERKSAVVTGGARGIGYATAEALLREGYGVVVGDKDKQRCDIALKQLAKLGDVRILSMDVSVEADVIKLIELCRTAFGGLDLLVNNASIVSLEQPSIIDMSLEEWNRRVAVNLTSFFLCTKYALPLLKQRRGSIVNMSSTRALMSEPNTETYSIAKGGIEALTHSLAISFGPDVRVNAIRPGWIDTRDDREEKPLPKLAHAQHPVGRVGKPEDIASLVVYLASPAAGFITGQSFTVDGGLTRKMIYEE